MARSIDPKCRKCRRAGEKLFLKGDRCLSPKCGVVRRAYAPGVHGKKITRALSGYGTQLMVKQKIKRTYGILEKQFRKHFEEVSGKKGIIGDLLLERLELRLDNVCYRMGLGSSRAAARQMVNHGWIAVNGKKVDIPSYRVKVGDLVSIRQGKKEKKHFKDAEPQIKNRKDYPSWINFDAGKAEGKVVSLPPRDEVAYGLDPQVVVEYYSR